MMVSLIQKISIVFATSYFYIHTVIKHIRASNKLILQLFISFQQERRVKFGKLKRLFIGKKQKCEGIIKRV